MEFIDDWIAHVIAYDYGFWPIDNHKFEPDEIDFSDRCFLFADGKNELKCLIKFDPYQLVPNTS